MGYYSKYTEEEFLNAFKEVIEHGNKIDKEFSYELELRGGSAFYEEKLKELKSINKEKSRIRQEVLSYLGSIDDVDFIKKMVTSELFSEIELNLLIERTAKEYDLVSKNLKVTSKTIVGGILSFLIGGSTIGVLFALSIVKYERIYYGIIGFAFLLTYLVAWVITKQTKDNVIIFLSSFASIFLALVLGLWLSGVIG